MTVVEAHGLPLRSIALQLGAAVVLMGATLTGLDNPLVAGQVLLGVAVLLAAVLALAVDEPGAEVLDATATRFAVRVSRRLALLSCAVLPLWLLTLAVVELRGQSPMLLPTLQAVALAALAIAVSAGLRRWRRMPEPALLVGPLLLGFLLAAQQLPRSLALMPSQPWGPPWEVVHLRWTAVLLAALSVLLMALSDPATASARRRPWRRA
jgi:hypothetical protein